MKRLVTVTLISMLAAATAACGAKTEPASDDGGGFNPGDDDDDDGAGDNQPVASAAASVVSGSAPLEVQFTGVATGGDGNLDFAWDFGDGETADIKDPSHTFTGAGVFSAVFTATDEDGDHAAATVVITVGNESVPVVSIVANPPNGPAPLNVGFTANASGGTAPFTFAWAFGDGATGASGTTTHMFSNPGSYLTRVTVTDADGDEAEATVTIVVGDTQNGGNNNNGAGDPDLELFNLGSYETGLEDSYEPNDARLDAWYLGDYGTDGMTYTVSDAYVDAVEVTFYADVVNYGEAIDTPFYVDFYSDAAAAPASGDLGDQFATVQSLGKLSSTRLYFTVDTPQSGAQSYVLADSLDDVSESDEDNNVSLPEEAMGAADEDWYSVYETSGYELSITLDQLPADYDIELYDEAGTKVASSLRAGTSAESITYAVPTTGEYFIRVFGYDGATSSTESYNLVVVVP